MFAQFWVLQHKYLARLVLKECNRLGVEQMIKCGQIFKCRANSSLTSFREGVNSQVDKDKTIIKMLKRNARSHHP